MTITTWLFFSAATLLGGCAAEGGLDTVEPSWTWSYDASCLTPTDEQQEAVARGVSLWDAWDVDLTYAPDGVDGVPHVRVCFVEGLPRQGFTGMTSGRAAGDALIEMSADRLRPFEWHYVTAHEFGHLVIGDHRLHLPDEELGLLSSSSKCMVRTADRGCTWSAADVEHLESLGLVHGGGR